MRFCDSLQRSEQKSVSGFDRSGRGDKRENTGDDRRPWGLFFAEEQLQQRI
jgi:hypothetical protein